MAPTNHVKPIVRRITRADEAFEQAQARAKRDEEATSFAYATEHGQSVVAAQAERMGIMSRWPAYTKAVRWFRDEWQDALPRAMHLTGSVEPQDAYGAPELTNRWRSYLYGKPGTGDSPEPIRKALRDMALSRNAYERCAAAFLFTMACMDFDDRAAGLAVQGHCLCDAPADDTPDTRPHANTRGCLHTILPLAPTFAPYYAQQAIERLREVVLENEKRGPRSLGKPEWVERLGIGKSEAQHAAEEAG